MTVTNWTFDELQLEFVLDYEKANEKYYAYSAKSELLHEMIIDCYKKKDFDSEIVKLLDSKITEVKKQRDKFYDVSRYLQNLKNGYPFHVRSSVGRYMVKFGLTQEQAEMFLSIRKKHKAAMGSENQKKYSLAHVQNVIWDATDDCLKVYYDDIWWHYDRNGCWW
jgi:hypothetical protein